MPDKSARQTRDAAYSTTKNHGERVQSGNVAVSLLCRFGVWEDNFLTRHPESLAALVALHREIDDKATDLVQHHGPRMLCQKGCHDCCRDDLTVFEIEAMRITTLSADLLEKEAPHPPGACAFLNEEGACRIYEHRPYVCRTQGLPLRWIEEEDGEWVEYRDICPLELDQIAPETLEEDECWTLGETEGKLAALQMQMDDGKGRRISLRSLFQHSGTWEV